MNIKKTVVASILCAATVMGANQSANATAYATSVMQLSNMQLFLYGTTTQVQLDDFTVDGGGLSGTNTGSASAGLNGVNTPQSTNTSNVISGLGVTLSPIPTLGSGAPVTPPFTANPPPVTVTNTYATGNAALTGSIIDVTNGSATPTPAAVASTFAEASLASAGVADAHSAMGLTSSFIFTATSALVNGVTLSFNYLAYLAVQLSPDEVIPGFVNASYKWGVSLFDVTDDLDVDITGSSIAVLNRERSLNAPFNGLLTAGSTSVLGPLSLSTGALIAGHQYAFTINQNSDVTIKSGVSVPEPASLFLIGFGLLGLAWSAKRKTSGALVA